MIIQYLISKKLKTIYTATTQNLDAAGISKATPSHTYRNDSFERIALATLRQAQKKKNSNMGCRVLWPIEQKVAQQIFFLVNRVTTTFIKGCQNRRALRRLRYKIETQLGCYERIRRQNLHASLHEQKEEQISIDSFSHEENQLQRQEYS